MQSEHPNQIDLVVYNGLFNRVLPIISALRLAKKSNRVLNILWTDAIGRSNLAFYGERTTFFDMYNPIENVKVDDKIGYNAKKYEFRYWDMLDHIVDINTDENIFIDFALYTLVSTDDESNIFTNLKKYITKPQEVIFDTVGQELGEIYRNHIKPVPEFQNEINKIYGTFLTNMIGLHIRSTDGGFTEIPWDNMVTKLISECKKWVSKGSDYGVFLATDNSDIYVKFVIALGNKLIFYVPPKVLGGSTSTSGEGEKFNNDRFNIYCGVIENYLLSKCNKYLIGTCESSFSFASMLGAEQNVKKYLINSVESIPNFY